MIIYGALAGAGPKRPIVRNRGHIWLRGVEVACEHGPRNDEPGPEPLLRGLLIGELNSHLVYAPACCIESIH
jgi:hypothetical protein